jgi:hypothetical protein
MPSAGRRLVVVSTNIGETSLTILNVRTVIDTGLARVRRFLPRIGGWVGGWELTLGPITKANEPGSRELPVSKHAGPSSRLFHPKQSKPVDPEQPTNNQSPSIIKPCRIHHLPSGGNSHRIIRSNHLRLRRRIIAGRLQRRRSKYRQTVRSSLQQLCQVLTS